MLREVWWQARQSWGQTMINLVPKRWVFLILLRAYREYLTVVPHGTRITATAVEMVNWWGTRAYPDGWR